MDLNKMINDSLAKIEAEGYVESVTEKRVKETINSIVSDLFSSYGDFGKNLKNEIKAQLDINLKELDIYSYNVMVINAINEHFRQELSERGIEKLKDQMNNLICNVKAEYKLSELIQQMKDEATEYDDDFWGGEISYHCSNSNDILIFIYFDPREQVERYHCKYKLSVDKEGTVASVKIDNCEFNNHMIMGGLHGLEETLFKIYASGAKVIVDDHNVVLEYNDDDGEED